MLIRSNTRSCSLKVMKTLKAQQRHSKGTANSLSYSTKGCTSGRVNDLKDHCTNNQSHKDAVSAFQNKQRRQLEQQFDKPALGKDLKREWLCNMVKVAFTMIMTNQPFSNFASNCLMVRWCGVVAMSVKKYLNRWMFKELLVAVAAEVNKDLLADIAASPTFGLQVDETTSLSCDKMAVIFISYWKAGRVVQHFLTLSHASDITANGITELMLQVLSDRGLPLSRLTGFSSDGASVMLGVNSGAATQLQRKQPYLLVTHCIAHRLALAASYASQKVGFVEDDIKPLIRELHSYFARSSVRFAGLKEWQEQLSQPQLKILTFVKTRWLSRHQCVSNIVRQYPAICAALRAAAAGGDDKAQQLWDQVSDMTVAMTLHHLADMLEHLSVLSKVFQSRDLKFSSIELLVESTIKWLEDNYANNTSRNTDRYGKSYKAFIAAITGTVYADFIDEFVGTPSDLEEEVHASMAAFAKHAVDGLHDRFPQDSLSVLTLSSIFDPVFLPQDYNSSELYGLKKLEQLCDFYASSKADGLDATMAARSVDKAAVLQEYPAFLSFFQSAAKKALADTISHYLVILTPSIQPSRPALQRAVHLGQLAMHPKASPSCHGWWKPGLSFSLLKMHADCIPTSSS